MIKMINIQYDIFAPKIDEGCRYISTNTDNKSENIFGQQYCQNAILSGKYGIPLLKPYIGEIPRNFISIGDLRARTNVKNSGIACFDTDQELEKFWRNPNRLLKYMSDAVCVTEPDFSLKIGTSLSIQITNTYRNHVLAYLMQESGIDVVPNMCWSNTQSYEFCFDGHSKGGWVCVSTIGTCKDIRSRMYFKRGFEEMLKHIEPDAVMLYGDINEEMLSWMPKQLTIQHVTHKRYERARYGK